MQARRGTPPSRRRIESSASSKPSRPPATNRCRIPSVASIGPPEYAYQPASCAMFSKPRSVRNRSSSSSGLMPGLEPPEDLQDQLLVEDDRRVRLLGADRARLAQLLSEPGEALDGAELDDPVLGRAACAPDRIRCTSSRTWRGSPSASRPPSTSSWYVSCVPVSKRTSTSCSSSGGSASRSDRAVDDGRVDHLARLRAEPALLA